MFRRVISRVRLAPLSARTFATTGISRASPFGLFMVNSYKDANILKQLNALPVTKRGKLLGKLYRALPVKERADLAARAKTIKFERKPKAPKVKRAPSAYNNFVKAKSVTPAIKALPFRQRMAAIAKLWKAQ